MERRTFWEASQASEELIVPFQFNLSLFLLSPLLDFSSGLNSLVAKTRGDHARQSWFLLNNTLGKSSVLNVFIVSLRRIMSFGFTTTKSLGKESN